jgi:molecular chaperone GrpE
MAAESNTPEGATVSSAPNPSAAVPAAPSEASASRGNGPAHASADKGREPGAAVAGASVPAGEPEAPTGPAPHKHDGHQGDDAEVGDRSERDDRSERESAEHERQLERDLDELSAKAQKADEYLELAQRTRADFENYRKRAAREAAAAQERGVVKLVRELLPAVDNLDRAVDALAAAESSKDGDDLVAGLKLVHAEVIAALGRAGVERFSPEGERFDPEHHEAVAQQPVQGAESGTIVEVYQRGYRLGGSVIRPARVLVAG